MIPMSFGRPGQPIGFTPEHPFARKNSFGPRRTMPPMQRVAMIVLLLAGMAAFGADTEPCSLTSTVPDATITIAISDGRTSFREGEIIPLTLSFTSTAEKRYWAENRNYDRSGRLMTESYCIEPAALDPLTDYFHGGFIGGGLGNEQQLSEKPFTATSELNEWRQPVPGHYRLYVVSHRVWRPPDPGEPAAGRRAGHAPLQHNRFRCNQSRP